MDDDRAWADASPGRPHGPVDLVEGISSTLLLVRRSEIGGRNLRRCYSMPRGEGDRRKEVRLRYGDSRSCWNRRRSTLTWSVARRELHAGSDARPS